MKRQARFIVSLLTLALLLPLLLTPQVSRAEAAKTEAASDARETEGKEGESKEAEPIIEPLNSGVFYLETEEVTNLEPDYAVLEMGISVLKPSFAEANDGLKEELQSLRDLLHKFDIPDEDIANSRYDVMEEQDYRNSPPTLSGYRAYKSYSVTIRDLAKVGEILDEAVKLGVNDLGEIRFESERRDEAIAELRQQAIAALDKKASYLAQHLGKDGAVETLRRHEVNFSELSSDLQDIMVPRAEEKAMDSSNGRGGMGGAPIGSGTLNLRLVASASYSFGGMVPEELEEVEDNPAEGEETGEQKVEVEKVENVNPQVESYRLDGTGTMRLRPDQLKFTFQKHTFSEESVADAAAQNDASVNILFDELKGAGVLDSQIETVAYEMGPVYDYYSSDDPLIAGYEVTHELSLKLKLDQDLTQISKILLSADLSSIKESYYSFENQSPVKAELSYLAVLDACEKLPEGKVPTSIVVRDYERSGDLYYDYGYGFGYPALSGAYVGFDPLSTEPPLIKLERTVTVSFSVPE